MRSVEREPKWVGLDTVRVWRGDTCSVAVGTMGTDGVGCSGLGRLFGRRSE